MNLNNELKPKKTYQNVLIVAFSNVCNMIAGILVGFLLPKIIGVTDYGYYKTFTLYASYVGLFHFGILDGIYLIYGGKDYDELEKTKFRFYSRFIFVLEIVISLVLSIVAIFTLVGEMKFIFICIAAYLLSSNITSYYQFISQITCRFSELSFRNVLKSIFTTLSIIVLWLIHTTNKTLLGYQIYTTIYVSINILLTIWYIITYKDITFGESSNFRNERKKINDFIKVGFPLMIANLCTILLLSIDRQLVNLLFDTESYAIYAFAYNMLAIITTATSAISIVVYPTLKRIDIPSLISKYSALKITILVFVFGCLLIYFPLVLFVHWFLPNYIDSLVIFRVILPGLAMSSIISIVIQNYYKTLGHNFSFFIKSVIILGISATANYVAYKLFGTTVAISISSVCVMFIWYLTVEFFLIKRYRLKWLSCTLYIIIMISLFYLAAMIENVYLGFMIYLFSFIGVSYIFYFKSINKILKKYLLH